MILFLLRRFVTMLVTLLIISALVFFNNKLPPGDFMTNQIAETIREKIHPLGVAVVCEGTHLCMSMRGVEKQNSFAITSAMLGGFQHDARTRTEFLELIRRSDVPSRASQCHDIHHASPT